MGFGAFCPFPLRLTTDTWSAAEYERAANDLAAAAHSLPLAVVRVSAAPGREITEYIGRNGVGLGCAPTLSSVSGTHYRIIWPHTYEDEKGDTVRWNIVSAQAGGEYDPAVGAFGTMAAVVVRANAADVYCFAPDTDAPFVLEVYGEIQDATDSLVGYGGDESRENCETERVPYAAQYYRILQDGQGSAYSKDLSGLNHAETLSDARNCAWAHRIIEKWRNEQTPGTASVKLPEWCAVLGVASRVNDTDAKRRARAAAAYQCLAGATVPNVDAAVEALLGKWYVKVWRNWNDSMTPATVTYGPDNPGPSQWDIGGGCWASEHAHQVIEVIEPSDAERGEFLTLVNVDLFQLLDRLLPDHVTWEWATNVEDGFRLDYGSLDYEGMAES